jgi:HAD superfamily hydrolase (TIGR01509 family)
MFRWIYFDVGNVLLNEDPLTFLVFQRHAEAVRRVHPEVSFTHLLGAWEARASTDAAWPLYEVVSSYLDDDGVRAVWDATDREVRARYDELSPPVPGAVELLPRLAHRFHLGLIANQPRECRDRLECLGWLGCFDQVLLSEEVGFYKPELNLFRAALERSGADPSECLMVGDRYGHDIAPAAALGMSTAWLRWTAPTAKGWFPKAPHAMAYRHALERLARRPVPRALEKRADFTLNTLLDLERSLGRYHAPWPTPRTPDIGEAGRR